MKRIINFLRKKGTHSKVSKKEVFWVHLHPKVTELAKSSYEIGNYADAISRCLREINGKLKALVLEKTGNELDGVALIERTFSVNNPIITFADLASVNGRNIHSGYKDIFVGAFKGIRNPKAHLNMNPSETIAKHLLFIVSFMFVKLDEAQIL